MARDLKFRIQGRVVKYRTAACDNKVVGGLVLDDILQRFPTPGQGQVVPDRYFILRHVVTTLSWRSLSKPEDEILVLCLLLRMGREEINQVMNGSKEQRMQRFWSLQRQIPRGVIVWQGVRLRSDGFRWAPASLLTPLRTWRDEAPFTPAQLTAEGLLTTYIGWVFTVSTSLEETFYILEKNSNNLFNVYPAHDESDLKGWVKGSPSSPQRYGVVVLSPVPERRYTYGALLSIHKHEGGIYFASYICQVNVERSKSGDAFEEGRFVRAFWGSSSGDSKGLGSFGVVAENDDRESTWCIG
jgi:hypothetical protein